MIEVTVQRDGVLMSLGQVAVIFESGGLHPNDVRVRYCQGDGEEQAEKQEDRKTRRHDAFEDEQTVALYQRELRID